MRRMPQHQMAINPLGFLLLTLFLGGILFIGGCGRKGDPVAPKDPLTYNLQQKTPYEK